MKRTTLFSILSTLFYVVSYLFLENHERKFSLIVNAIRLISCIFESAKLDMIVSKHSYGESNLWKLISILYRLK